MTFDLAAHCPPASSALVVFECQEGVVLPTGHLPGLAAAVEAGDVIEHIAALQEAARTNGVPVFFCAVRRRADGVGNPFNTPLEQRLRARAGDAGTVPEMGPIVEALAPRPGEVVVERQHGLTGFYESGLDAYLRNCGVRTLVLTGVSVNLGILGTAIEAVNRGYRVVVPTDAVAGDPPEYAEQALRYSVRNVAFLSTSDEIAAIWREAGD